MFLTPVTITKDDPRDVSDSFDTTYTVIEIPAPDGPSPGDLNSSQQAARGRPSSQVSLPQPRQSYSSTFVFVVSVSVVSNLSAAPAKATVMPVKSG